MSEQDRTVMASTTVITCAEASALINYTYHKDQSALPTLNPMGTFYRGSHYHKSTQHDSLMNWIEDGSPPQAGDVFTLGDENLELTATSKLHANFQAIKRCLVI